MGIGRIVSVGRPEAAWTKGARRAAGMSNGTTTAEIGEAGVLAGAQREWEAGGDSKIIMEMIERN